MPVPADYNGDRRMDVAVYRPATGYWFVRNQAAVQFGDPGDKPVPHDYNGDGVMDVAVYRPSTGQWFVRDQSAVVFGGPSDIPVPGDYNGDGEADIAQYRPSTGHGSSGTSRRCRSAIRETSQCPPISTVTAGWMWRSTDRRPVSGSCGISS